VAVPTPDLRVELVHDAEGVPVSQISAMAPASMRYLDTPVYSFLSPVGGRPRNAPSDVPAAAQRAATISP
jgi:hypothetical protein